MHNLAQDQQCIIGSFYDDFNDNDFESLSMIDTGSWYLNLEFPLSCSGRVYSYEVMYFKSGPGSSRASAVTVSLWNLDSDQMYSIIVSESFIIIIIRCEHFSQVQVLSSQEVKVEDL